MSDQPSSGGQDAAPARHPETAPSVPEPPPFRPDPALVDYIERGRDPGETRTT